MIDLTIAPGTKVVIIEAGWMKNKTLAEFVKSTPSNRIVVKDSFGRIRTFNPDGTERGNRNSFGSRATTRLARQSDLDEFEGNKIIEQLQNLFRTNGVGQCNAHEMKIEDLRAMKKIVDDHNNQF